MTIRFHSLRDRSAAARTPAVPPTVHASTTSFRQLLRLVDRNSAFHVRRWNNDLYLEEDPTLSARHWLQDQPSPELLALLDAADWADQSAAPRRVEDQIEPSCLTWPDNCGLEQLLRDEETTPSLSDSTRKTVAMKTSSPTLKRARSVDSSGLQVVPYRTSADERTLRAFTDCCRGRLSWRRHRHLFFSGFRLMLAHDLDVIVNETAGSTILFKSENALSNMDKIDLWLEAMLTGSNQIALIRKDDSATAFRDPKIHFISSNLLRPDELTQKKTMITSFELLTFLAQNCSEGKRYRLFRDGAHQLVLMEAEDLSQLEDDAAIAPEAESTSLIESGQAPLHFAVAGECLRLAARLEKGGYPDVARRLLESARDAVQDGRLYSAKVESLLKIVDDKIWRSTLSCYRAGKASRDEMIDAVPAYLSSCSVPDSAQPRRFLAEVEFIHALHSSVSESAKKVGVTQTEIAYGIVIATFLRLHSLACAMQRCKACSVESTDDAASWLALTFAADILTTYLRLSNFSDTLLISLPQADAIMPAVRAHCADWETLKPLWRANSQFSATEDVLRHYSLLLAGERIAPLAVTALHHIDGYREKICAALWDQLRRTGAHLLPAGASASPLECVAQVFLVADETLIGSGNAEVAEGLGASLMLFARIYNDLAVIDLFSLDMKRRREHLSRATSQLIFAMHALRLYFVILLTRTELANTQDSSALKYATEWLCVVSLNLIRAIQLNSNSFRVGVNDNLRGALVEGGCPPGEDITSCFSSGQYEAYLSAIALARRLHSFAETLVVLREGSDHGVETAEGSPELPLQTGLCCDQLLRHKVSVRPYFKYSLPQLSAICRERVPYMSMSMAVDMMQYSPLQKVLVSDDKWKRPTSAPQQLPENLLSIARSFSLPKVMARIKAGQVNKLVSQECINACLELCEPVVDALYPAVVVALCPSTPPRARSDLFITPEFAVSSPDEYPSEAFLPWLESMRLAHPHSAEEVHTTPSLFEGIPKDARFSNLVSGIDLAKIPDSEYQQWVPSAIGCISDVAIRRAALSIVRPLSNTSEMPLYPTIGARMAFGNGSRVSEHRLATPSRDLATIVQTQLQFAAENFRVDEREAAAAHYHLGVYLNSLNSQPHISRRGQQATLQKRLREKRQLQALSHLKLALRAFSPAYCLKDFVNVQSVLFDILDAEGSFLEATSLVLAGDLYAAECKNEQPDENFYENSKFIEGSDSKYLGVHALRSLASTGLLKVLKRGRDHEEPITISKNDSCRLLQRATEIHVCLTHMSDDELKSLYKMLLKKQSFQHFFPS